MGRVLWKAVNRGRTPVFKKNGQERPGRKQQKKNQTTQGGWEKNASGESAHADEHGDPRSDSWSLDDVGPTATLKSTRGTNRRQERPSGKDEERESKLKLRW